MRTTRTTTDSTRTDQATMGLAEGLITPRYVSLHGNIPRLPFLRLLFARVLSTFLFYPFPPSPRFAVLGLGSSWSPLCQSFPVAPSLFRCSRLSGSDLLAPFRCVFLRSAFAFTSVSFPFVPSPVRFLSLPFSSLYISPFPRARLSPHISFSCLLSPHLSCLAPLIQSLSALALPIFLCSCSLASLPLSLLVPLVPLRSLPSPLAQDLSRKFTSRGSLFTYICASRPIWLLLCLGFQLHLL